MAQLWNISQQTGSYFILMSKKEVFIYDLLLLKAENYITFSEEEQKMVYGDFQYTESCYKITILPPAKKYMDDNRCKWISDLFEAVVSIIKK